MSYRLQDQETVSAGIKRIADEQIESSIHQLTHNIQVDRAEAIHGARKHFKKLRALMRLVRDDVSRKAYEQENACFRNAGRELSDVRDAEVRIETLDKVIDHFGDFIQADQFQGIRQVLVDACEAARTSNAPSELEVAEVVSELEAAQARIQEWHLHNDWKALRTGLHRVYKQGYKDCDRACDQPTPENLHEWRKRTKDLWYHLRILAPMWPELLKALRDQAEELAELLGDDHDLTVLRLFIMNDLEAFADDDDQLGVLLALIQRRQIELQTQARFLGQRLYAEKPKAFIKRMGRYWRAWQAELSQPPVVLPESSSRSAIALTNV